MSEFDSFSGAIKWETKDDYEKLFQNTPLLFSSPFQSSSILSNLSSSYSYHQKCTSNSPQLKEQSIQGRRKNNSKKKILLCHDFRGNYLNDRYVNGSEYNNCYEVTDWSLIDIFCYFSHQFITIPPLSWNITCKKHDVKIIGTVITEWGDGAKICQELFHSPENAIETAQLLIQLASITQIDGWLINIENPLPLELIDNLKLFLTTLTTGMHALLGENSSVIWYDAVTIEGQLRWQDKLNHLNKPFFDLCDGIFINYTWTKDSIAITLETLADCQRQEDVYYGIDVFGRNCIGGYDCCDSILKLCTENETESQFSIAIFAPAWILETQVSEPEVLYLEEERCTNKTILHRYGTMNSSLHSAYEQFWKRISKVWIHSSSCQYLPIQLNGSLSNNHNSNSNTQIFSTKFSTSTGLYVFVEGECYPHWLTIDTSTITKRSSTEKTYRKLLEQDPSSSPSPSLLSLGDDDIDIDDGNINTLLCLQTIPFYNLSLQDMKYRIQQNESEETTKIKITNRYGWNGTGSMRFLSPSSFDLMGVASPSLEIPLLMDLSSFDNELAVTIHLNYFSLASSFCFNLDFEIDLLVIHSETGLTSTHSFTIRYILKKSNEIIQVFSWINGSQNLIPSVTKLLCSVQSSPKYYWKDVSFPDLPQVKNLDGVYWNHSSFQVRSHDCLEVIQSSEEWNHQLALSKIFITNSHLYLSEIESDISNLGFVLGSFDLISSFPPPLPFLNPTSCEEINIQIINLKMNDICGCQADNRISMTLSWDEINLLTGNESLSLSEVNFFTIINPEILTALVSSTQIQDLNSYSYQIISKSSSVLPQQTLIRQEDLILAGSTILSHYHFNLTQDMGHSSTQLGLSLPSQWKYFALLIRPSLQCVQIRQSCLNSCPVVLIQYPVPAVTAVPQHSS